MFMEEKKMRVQQIRTHRITEMSEREYRAYKRMLRRKREQRRRAAIMLMTVFLIATCVFSYRALTSHANENEKLAMKAYTGVIIKNGDSLWSISDNYIDYDYYKSKKAYIDEVCSINRLWDEDDIYIGQRVIFPYYTFEYGN